MKTIAVVFACCLVGALGAFTEEQKSKLIAYKNSCMTETGVSETVVENAKKGTLALDDEKLGCFTMCMLKKIGIVNPDGTVNEEVLRAKTADLPEEKYNEIIPCKDITGPNECQRGNNLVKCFFEHKKTAVHS